MSRIAKKPIVLPPKTEASYATGFVTVKGPLGELKRYFRSQIDIKIADGAITLTPASKSLEAKALWVRMHLI